MSDRSRMVPPASSLDQAARRLADRLPDADSGSVQLARYPADGATTTDDPLEGQPTTADLAFANTAPMEAFRGKVYDDRRGVPTIGYGYALAVHGRNGWVARPDADLAQAGITLSPADAARLRSAVGTLKTLGSGSGASTALTAALGNDPFDLALDRTQARQAFDAVFPYYRDVVSQAVGQANYDSLLPEQQAALIDFAYRRPRWMSDNARHLQPAMTADQQSGNWENTLPILKRMRVGQDDWRTNSNILYFANPRAENIYQVQPGDRLDDIVRKTGLTKDYLELLNRRDNSAPDRPYVSNWNRLNAGQRIFIADPKHWRGGPVR